jgi:hypothetical protein
MIGIVTAMGAAALRDWRWILAIFADEIMIWIVGAARSPSAKSLRLCQHMLKKILGNLPSVAVSIGEVVIPLARKL